MGEAVPHEAELALLDVLLDGIERLLLADLHTWSALSALRGAGRRRAGRTHLHLRIGPAGDLHDHVEDGLAVIGIEGDVVEGRDGHAILLDVDAVLERVRRSDLARGVGRHGCLLFWCRCREGLCWRGGGGGGGEMACELPGAGLNFVDDGRRGGGAGRRRQRRAVISQLEKRH